MGLCMHQHPHTYTCRRWDAPAWQRLHAGIHRPAAPPHTHVRHASPPLHMHTHNAGQPSGQPHHTHMHASTHPAHTHTHTHTCQHTHTSHTLTHTLTHRYPQAPQVLFELEIFISCEGANFSAAASARRWMRAVPTASLRLRLKAAEILVDTA